MPKIALERSKWGRKGLRLTVAVGAMAAALGGAGRDKACAQTVTAQVQGVSQSSMAGPVAPVPVPGKGAATGHPVPRFVSLKSDRVYMRSGPGTEHGIQWVYNRAGLPIEVIAEADAWRRVRDSEGSVGWVLASLLSGRRTALIEPWSLKGAQAPPQVALRLEARESSQAVAQIEAGVIAGVRSCDGRWCEVTIAEYRGFVEQHRLWGVYKGESVR
jgi:SH3-like domain-containing protein